MLVVPALLACVVSGVRVVKRSEGASKTTAAMIGGVPVHNYRADATDFMVLFAEGTRDADIEGFCEGQCDFHGHPDAKGAPFAKVHGVDKLAELVRKHPERITILEPDEIDYETEIEIGPDASATSWGLAAIGVDSRPSTGKGVHVYVQDTGVHLSHSDFEGRAIAAMDMTSGSIVECADSSCAADVRGHGTHCAGTAAGRTWGVASDATIHAVKTLNDQGSGSRSWQIAAIDWVSSRGEKPAVLSMSLGGSGVTQAYQTSILAATEAGVVVVVAAGNDNDDACGRSPAFAPAAITVGATTSSDARASYSNFGSCLDIMAPGSSILSASVSSSGYTSKSGTSMATPHVSGAAALLLEKDPSLGSSGVMATLERAGTRGKISGLMENDPDLFLWVGPAAPETPTSASLKELVTGATARGMDHLGLRDQLQMLYPNYEWVVLRLSSSLSKGWSWASLGFLISGNENMLAMGAVCPRPPACGKCESEVQAGFSAIDSSNASVMRTELWDALESSDRRNVATAVAGGWNLAWAARPEGQRCMFYGSGTMGRRRRYGDKTLFVFQLKAASALQALNATPVDSDADLVEETNASPKARDVADDLGDDSSTDASPEEDLDVSAESDVSFKLKGEIELGEASAR